MNAPQINPHEYKPVPCPKCGCPIVVVTQLAVISHHRFNPNQIWLNLQNVFRCQTCQALRSPAGKLLDAHGREVEPPPPIESN